MATERDASGFWPGFLTGTLLAAAIGLALAWVFPPVPTLPPEVAPEALVPPVAPDRPADPAEPEAAPVEGLLSAPPDKPLIAGVPAPDAAPVAPDAAAPGSPSLVPGATP
jgi:hypothetical protein